MVQEICFAAKETLCRKAKTEEEEMRQQQRIEIMTDVTRKIKRQNGHEQQLVGQ